MSKILSYVRLHFKLMFKRDKTQDTKSTIITSILGVITFAVLLFLFKYLFDIINTQFLADLTYQQFSVCLYVVMGIILTIVGVVFEVKIFLKSKDAFIVARFPMSNTQIFISQLIIVYINLLAISLIIFLPLLLMYGWANAILSFLFVLGAIFTTFLAPLIPFALATLIFVPAMYILILLDNKNILKLILFLLFLTFAFICYNILLNFLADFYVHQRVDSGVYQTVVSFIGALNIKWNIFTYLNSLLYFDNILASLGLILGAFAVIMAIGILVAVPAYSRVRKNILEGNKSIFEKMTKIADDKPFVAILKKEAKTVVRTSTYAYFYLGICIVTPVMVFLTNSLVQKVGSAQMGGNIAFGISLIVVLAFMCMINSFSASAISREGKEFYITKIIPVDFRLQLIAKGALNFILSFLALVSSVVILLSMEFISIVQGLIVFLVAIFLAVGIILNGFNINVSHPHIKANSLGEESQTNTTLILVISFVLSAILGLIAIIFSFLINFVTIYLILLSISIIYFAINILIFIFTTNKKYNKIE